MQHSRYSSVNSIIRIVHLLLGLRVAERYWMLITRDRIIHVFVERVACTRYGVHGKL
jgi:hypothetical protein